jgi:hypothetical protein
VTLQTLVTYYGLILVSFLTLFVQFSGGCFFRTLCFILHQRRSTLSCHDGLFHQQQIILRNAATAPNALMSLTRSAFIWRNKVSTPFGRSFPLLAITALHIGSFAAAGLFSSQIASTSDGQALLESSVCGYPQKLDYIKPAYHIANITADIVPIFNTQVLLVRWHAPSMRKATDCLRRVDTL